MVKITYNPAREAARDILVGHEVRELFAEAELVPSGYQSPSCSFDAPTEMNDGHLVVGNHYDIALGRDGRMVTVYTPMNEDEE